MSKRSLVSKKEQKEERKKGRRERGRENLILFRIRMLCYILCFKDYSQKDMPWYFILLRVEHVRRIDEIKGFRFGLYIQVYLINWGMSIKS